MTAPFDYAQGISRIQKFLASLATTNVNFLYFHAKELDTPLVKTTFKKCVLQDTKNEYYLLHGHSANYVYAYQTSDLKAFVRLNDQPEPNNPRETPAYLNQAFQVTVVQEKGPDTTETFIGNHIDFSVFRQRDNDPLFKVHYTVYSQWDTMEAYRNEDTCNFKLSYVNFNKFTETKCLNTTGAPNGQNCQGVLHGRSDIVRALTRVVVGQNLNNVTPDYHVGKHGGRYRMNQTKKVYKRGGTGFAFIDRLIPYIVTKFLKPLLHTGYETCSVFYDANNELNAGGSTNFVFVYHFEQGNIIQRFFVDAKVLTQAAFEQKPEAQHAIDTQLEHIQTRLAQVAAVAQ